MISEAEFAERLKKFDATYGGDIGRIDAEIDGFNKAFPENEIGSLTKERYALGTKVRNESNFSWWIEYGTKEVAAMGGFAKKHRLYFSKKGSRYEYPKSAYKSEDECLEDIKGNLKKLYRLVKSDALQDFDDIELPHNQSIKLAYLLNRKGFLPILDSKHLDKTCEALGIDRSSLNSLQKNRKILERFNANPVSRDWHTAKKAHFCYSEYGFDLKSQQSEEGGEDATSADEVAGDILTKKGQVILYGPPGTGKTHSTRMLAVDLITDGQNSV